MAPVVALGAIAKIAGWDLPDEKTVKLLLSPFGIAASVIISMVPIKWVLGKDFGNFRVVLIQIGEQPEATNVMVTPGKCPECAADVDTTDRFCDQCGTRLDAHRA